jgi:putative membrane protein
MNTLLGTTRIPFFTRGLIAALAVCAALTASAADTSRSDSSTTTTSTTSTKPDRKDASFIKEAAEGGLAEVQMGKLAAANGSNEQIKQLGQRIQQDHAKANQELTEIAQKAGVTLPATVDHKDMRMENKLEGKTGAEFDKAFAEHALKDHEKDIQKFQKALQSVRDPELRAFIEKNLPVLREHLQMARTAASAVGVNEKAIAAADRFLSNQSGTSNQGLGTPGSSQTGAGANQNSGSDTSSGSSTTTTPHDNVNR